MGKAKRFNPYDETVKAARERAKSFGESRQKLAGITSPFRSSPLVPPITTKLRGTGTGDGKFLTVSLAGDQTSNIATNNHIEWDTKDEDGGIVLQTGAGQSDGIFELLGGRKYYLQASLRPEFSGTTGQLEVAWFDQTNSAQIGSRAKYEAMDHSGNDANQPTASAIVTPTTNILVKVEILSVTALDGLANEYCHANLFEIALGGVVLGGGGSGGSSGVTFPITPSINDHGNVGTVTEDIDIGASTGHVHKLTLTGNPTLTFSNPPSSGVQMEFEIEYVQDATGGRTVTQPGSVAEKVSIATTASTTTIVTYRTNDNGTTYHAIPALRGSISLGSTGFATKELDNLNSPAFNVDINVNDKELNNVQGIDFKAGGPGDTTTLPVIWADASGNMVLNIATADQFLFTINGATRFDFSEGNAQFTSTDQHGVDLILNNQDSTPLDSDRAGRLKFDGDDDGGTQQTWGTVTFDMKDVSAGALQGRFLVGCQSDNSLQNIIDYTGDDGVFRFSSGVDVVRSNATGNDLGSQSIPWLNTYTTNLILDSDGDSKFTSPSDDRVDLELLGVSRIQWTLSSMLMALDIDLNAKDLIMDADGDTKISATTDDRIDIDTPSGNVLQIDSAGGLTWSLSGVGHGIDAGATSFTFTAKDLTDAINFDLLNSTHRFQITDTAIQWQDPAGPLIFDMFLNDTSVAASDVQNVGSLRWRANDDVGTESNVLVINPQVLVSNDTDWQTKTTISVGDSVGLVVLGSDDLVGKIGFFNIGPVIRQTSTNSTPTADLTYSSNERDMINNMWDALVAYGLMDET